jgi:hypothetical protein
MQPGRGRRFEPAMEDVLVATLTVQNSHSVFQVTFEFLNFSLNHRKTIGKWWFNGI